VIFLLLVLLGTAVRFCSSAQEQRADAELQRTQAEFQRDKARTQLLARQARRTEREAQSLNEISFAGALALESIWLGQKINVATEPDAIETIRSVLMRQPLMTILHGAAVRFLVALPNGRLASEAEDGTIKLWPKNGRGEPMVLTHSDLGVSALTVLPDGRLVSSGADGTIKVWLVDEPILIVALPLRAGRNLTKNEWVHYIGANSSWQPSCRNLPSNWRTPD